jgi:hypothetical protein
LKRKIDLWYTPVFQKINEYCVVCDEVMNAFNLWFKQ